MSTFTSKAVKAFTSHPVRTFLSIVWAVLYLIAWVHSSRGTWDPVLIGSLVMLGLTFPSGLLLLTLSNHLNLQVNENLGWAVTFIAGYLQWFCLVPFIFRKVLK